MFKPFDFNNMFGEFATLDSKRDYGRLDGNTIQVKITLRQLWWVLLGRKLNFKASRGIKIRVMKA